MAMAVLMAAGCGAESVGTAVTAARLQAEQAWQGKETLDAVKAGLDAAAQTSQERLERAEKGESEK